MQALGDLAQGLVLRQRLRHIKEQISMRSVELSTGVSEDPAAHVGSDLGMVVSLKRSLSSSEAFRITSIETQQLAATMQSALGLIQDTALESARSLVTAALHHSSGAITAMAQSADSALASVLANLNTSLMGRSIFAGTATDRAPLLDIDTLKNLIRVELAGLTSLDDIRSTMDNWFHDIGGGFETVFYNGSNRSLAPVRLSDTQAAQLTIRADDPEIRDVIKELVVASLSDDPSLGFSNELKTDLLKSAGEALLSGQASLVEIRAGLGALEERIESALSNNAAVQSATELAMSNFLGIDEYDAATRLEQAQFQLESLYAVTARASRLNLVGYLR